MAGITDDMVVAAMLFKEACRKAGAQRPTGVYYDPEVGVSIDMTDRDGNSWSFTEADDG